MRVYLKFFFIFFYQNAQQSNPSEWLNSLPTTKPLDYFQFCIKVQDTYS
jgi:hypothetical protein